MKLETLQKDMIAAMKAKDKERKDSISSLIGAIKKVAIDEKVRENIPEELVDRVILKEMKSVKEQIDTCPAERTDRYLSCRQNRTVGSLQSSLCSIRRICAKDAFCRRSKSDHYGKIRRCGCYKEQRHDHEKCHGRIKRQSRR